MAEDTEIVETKESISEHEAKVEEQLDTVKKIQEGKDVKSDDKKEV